MSELARLESSRVDAALGAWRHTTVERRSTWDLEQAEAVAEMLRRRQRSLLIASVTTFCVSLLAGTAFALFTHPMTRPAPAAATASTPAVAAAPLATIGDGPTLEASRIEVESLRAGFKSDVRAWQNPEALWVHFDYTGSPLTLKWTDAGNRAVMEPMPCVNNASASVRRCYIGRSAERVQTAFEDEHARPGTWTVHACRDSACTPVGSYSVNRSFGEP